MGQHLPVGPAAVSGAVLAEPRGTLGASGWCQRSAFGGIGEDPVGKGGRASPDWRHRIKGSREGGRETVLKNLGWDPVCWLASEEGAGGSRGRGSGRARGPPCGRNSTVFTRYWALAFGPLNALEGLDTEVVAVSVHLSLDPATGTPASRKFPRGWSFPRNSPVTFPFCEPASLSLVPCLHGLPCPGMAGEPPSRLRS